MTSLSRPRRLLGGLLSALAAAAVVVAPWQTSVAQTTRKTDASARSTSLGMAPADAAFYSASLGLGDTLARFGKSKAFDRLKNLEGVKTLTEEFMRQWNDPTSDFAQAKAVFEDPGTQQTLAFLGDMMSHETWSYGDMKHADLVELGTGINLAMREAQFKMQMMEAQGENPDPMLLVNALIKALDTGREKIVIPNSITGFKVADTKRAAEQLAILDGLISAGVQGNPQLQPNYNKKTIAGAEYMVLDLKGNMVPWQLVGFFVQGIDFAAFNRVVGKLNQLELTIGLGMKDDHVLLLIGSSGDYLKTLGTEKVLYDRKEFAPLRKHDGKKFTSFSYVSEAYKKRVGDPGEAIAAMQQVAEAMLPQLPINDDLRQMITKDLDGINEWMDSLDYKPGANVSFEFETETGYEGFAYDWTSNDMIDGSKPLPLLKHVGGNPVGFMIVRSQYRPEDYDAMVVVLTKVYDYVETYLMGELNDDDRAQYEKVMALVKPHLKKLDETTKNKLVPAMKDSQGGIVLDMKSSSRQWFTEMPPAQKPLPIPEIAFVYGVSDDKLLQSAIADYHNIAQGLLDDMHEFSPDEIPAIKLPNATKSEVGGGTVYKHVIPNGSGLDEQIAPSAGFGESIAVWSYVPGLAQRVLEPTPLAAKSGPLANLDRNLAGAAAFNFEAFVDGIEPWVEYGVAQYFASQAVSTDGDFVQFSAPPMDDVIKQVRTVAEVLKCFKGYSSVTYVEEGATVTHFDYRFEDLE